MNVKEKTGMVYGDGDDRVDIYAPVRKKFPDFDNSTLFALATVIGFNNDLSKELVKKKYIFKKHEIEKRPQEYNTIVAIAMAHSKSLSAKESLELLLDKNKIYEIAEKYANGGIKFIYSEIFENRSGPDFIKTLETEFRKAIKNNK